MTLIITVMLATGVVFILSAIENQSIIQTMQQIMEGNPINWQGATSASTPTSGGPNTGQQGPPSSNPPTSGGPPPIS